MTDEKMMFLIEQLLALSKANDEKAAAIKSIREWIDANK